MLARRCVFFKFRRPDILTKSYPGHTLWADPLGHFKERGDDMGKTRKVRPGPPEERNIDPVVSCQSKFRDIEEFPGEDPAPDELLALKERLSDPATPPDEAEAIEEILCPDCA